MTQFRQHEERHVSGETLLMKWNPKFDLVAIAHRNADVTVYRLVGWQKVWQLPSPTCKPVPTPPSSGATPTPSAAAGQGSSADRSSKSATKPKRVQEIHVTSLEWRPDGKVLAVSYSRRVGRPSSVSNVPPGPAGPTRNAFRNDIRNEMKEDWTPLGTSKTATEEPNENTSSVCLVDVENGQVFRILDVDVGIVSCLCWQQFERSDERDTSDDPQPDTDCAQFADSCLPDALQALPPLEPLAKSYVDRSDANNLIPGAATQNQDDAPPIDEPVDDLLRVASQRELSILAVGTDQGHVQMYALGVLKCGLITLPNSPRVIHVALASDLQFVNVVHEQTAGKYAISTHSIEQLRTHRPQYFVLALLYCRLVSLLKYLHECMQRMYETWEEILLEIDNKLSNYLLDDKRRAAGEKAREVLLADEFLELLVFGSLTDTLEKFLHNFTDKGLKKLGLSIENTYQGMQKLIVGHLQPVNQYVFAYTHTLRAMCQWTSEFGPLGLDGEFVQQALRSIGSFHLKTIEMQQVVDHSLRNVRCFFKWLYSMMLRVHSDPVPPSQHELCKISRRELELVADFIQENFEHDEPIENVPDASSFLLDLSFQGDESKDKIMEISIDCESVDELLPFKTRSNSGQRGQAKSAPSTPAPRPPHRPTASNFTLERVGQYLKDTALSYTSASMNDLGINPWIAYVREQRLDTRTNAFGQTLLYPHSASTSLLQECRQLERAVRKLFDGPFNSFCEHLSTPQAQLSELPAPALTGQRTARFTHNRAKFMAFAGTEHTLHVLRFDLSQDALQSNRVRFVDALRPQDTLHLVDLNFYSDEVLTLLLHEPRHTSALLVQFHLSAILDECAELPFECTYTQMLAVTEPITVEVRAGITCSGGLPPTVARHAQPMQVRRLEHFRGAVIAVSGSRKLCCVSNVSRRRVRVFEMDSCEDESADEEETDVSVTQLSRHNISSSSSAVSPGLSLR
jgi:hypothetical protein